MSFIHYLFAGDFERDNHGVRFARSRPGDPYHPIVARPLTADLIASVVKDVTNGVTEAIPDDWSAWLDDGYLVCDKYTKNADEIDFISRLVERTGIALYDRAAHSDVSLSDWLAVAHGTAGHPS